MLLRLFDERTEGLVQEGLFDLRAALFAFHGISKRASLFMCCGKAACPERLTPFPCERMRRLDYRFVLFVALGSEEVLKELLHVSTL